MRLVNRFWIAYPRFPGVGAWTARSHGRLARHAGLWAQDVWPVLRRLLRGATPLTFGLLVLAIASELPVLAVRVLLLQITMGILSLAGVHLGMSGEQIVLLVPLVWPVCALACPFPSGWWWRQSEGGRDPSDRELLAYQDSIDMLNTHASGKLALPTAWFVVDSPYPEAAVCAQTLMLSRGLLESEYLPVVVAHELGHIANGDGRLTAAINRLVVFRPRQSTTAASGTQSEQFLALSIPGGGETWPLGLLLTFLFWAARSLVFMVRFARGGCGLRLVAPLLAAYWREREYHADDYAASLGQAEELAEFLEAYALVHDRPTPFIWLSEHSHPPSELRISRLRAHAERETGLLPTGTQGTGVAAGSEPVKGRPTGRLRRVLTDRPLTEPDPSAKASLTSAGQALPSTAQPNNTKGVQGNESTTKH